MQLTVRPVRESDAEAWTALYSGYRAFYDLPDSADAVRTTWEWMLGREHGMTGLVAVDDDDRPVGLANLRWFARPSVAGMGLYLDDLFTAPEARGTGAATALLRAASAMAADAGATVVRWITASDNSTARRLYEVHAVATPWVTYDMEPGGSS